MKSIFLLVSLFCLSSSIVLSAEGIRIAELSNGQKYIANQILVANKYDTPAYLTEQGANGIAVTGVSSVDELCSEFGVIKVEPFYPGHLKKPALIREISRMYIFTLENDFDPEAVLPVFADDPHIEFAELRHLPTLNYVPNDSLLGWQWYLAFTQTYEAWDTVRGDTTKHAIIGIVDSGVHWNHPDLAANIWVNPGEDLNHNGIFENGDLNGIDDDHNGFIDDVVGYDFGDHDYNPSDDAVPHGTAVAGCASEIPDNYIMGAGIGFNARIMCLKGFSDSQGPTNLYDGIIYAADMGAQIINCSWGSLSYSQAEQNIVNAVWTEGALIIASAGGQGDTTRNYPAAYNHVVAVAATDDQDHRATFSGYGRWVDICAPGVNIWSTAGQSEFTNFAGTSFSTAMVSGLAALVCAWHPNYTNDQIETAIKQSADTFINSNGLLGAGRINCASAVSLFLTDINENINSPKSFSFQANYPNPFNAQTTFSFVSPSAGQVTFSIYDILGRKIDEVISEFQEAGAHTVIWEARSLPSGPYFARMTSIENSPILKMLLLK